MDIAAAVQEYWSKNADAIAAPAGVHHDDFFPDKSRFDPRKWIILAENAQQKDVEELVAVSGSANQSIIKKDN